MYYYVYILQSISYPERYYIGFTEDLKERIKKHNEGGSSYTSNTHPGNWLQLFHFLKNIKH